jgi:nucleolar protein 16
MKKVPPIRGPKVLQEAWDKRKTVRQNYVKLGLTLNLNPLAHGGFERPTDASIQEPSPASPAIDMVDDDEPYIPTGFGRILRDDTGNIIGFEASKAEECTDSEVVEVEGLQLDVDDRAVHQRWAANFSSSHETRMDPQGKCVLRELEQISAPATGSTTLSIPISGVGPRYMSSGEIKYLEPLVKKYGDDVHAMSQDHKLNPEQRTVGQLRRALKKSTGTAI